MTQPTVQQKRLANAVVYRLVMLRYAGPRFAALSLASPAPDDGYRAERNAYIDSFALNARELYGFFCNKGGQNKGLAVFEIPAEWRPRALGPDDDIWKLADAHVTHLPSSRAIEGPPGGGHPDYEDWPVAEMLRRLSASYAEFRTHPSNCCRSLFPKEPSLAGAARRHTALQKLLGTGRK